MCSIKESRDAYRHVVSYLARHSERSERQVAETAVALAASARGLRHGADVATIPPPVIYKLAEHPLTKSGLENFVKDWKSTGQSIL